MATFNVTASVSFSYDTEDGLVSNAEEAYTDCEEMIRSGDLSVNDYTITVEEVERVDEDCDRHGGPWGGDATCARCTKTVTATHPDVLPDEGVIAASFPGGYVIVRERTDPGPLED